MIGKRIKAYIFIAISFLLVYFVYYTEYVSQSKPFQLGLDLKGGAELVYNADVSKIPREEVADAMNALRDVIERRVDAFGVAEPIIRTSSSSFVTDSQIERLIVELPGVTDVDAAIEQIGKTPLLEFRLLRIDGNNISFEDTGITGRYVESSDLYFPQGLANTPTGEIGILVNFNGEGAKLFEQITSENVGEYLAIFLDGTVISQPIINEPIPGGTASITGNFTADEARELSRNLNFGALPVPIEIEGVQTIGATLGEETIKDGVNAAIVGFLLIILFLIAWYRLSGFVATVSLITYVAIMLLLFKFIPVTLTAAGLAGFIISIGIAVDANVLIFERIKEEIRSGSEAREAINKGFARAWLSIRDGNLTSLIIAILLFWLGTSLIKGFAFTFGMGIIVSMFTAIVFSRTLLRVFGSVSRKTLGSIIFGVKEK
ncbi:MAG: protein translocase subunit SecD [Candidatus Campbellbacteria bacterium]|nr:protein translocase subunit SecD [Candidatus Campbellbacteria bacterium]